ncbi:hypothetical protein MESS2_580030 [Mesorhizobium metallidurans STM 2683]|uniref:Uncharacterized protein n=1 Tax=Mesorhizobium metallidurans STM 2683 TaxID=1297569 RepID=M5ET94_9HYPH|nr:hypothetical protein MESS2_580030 [Mesorhizobium metallidurans STM 2683]
MLGVSGFFRQKLFLTGAAGSDPLAETLSLEEEPVWHRYGVMFWLVLVWPPCWPGFSVSSI